ncbi:MAG: zinc ABC transporter substrate-binding protein [Phycisphaerales bacterium]|nr:zinc ABC transporter substrate-binding protein [Phycisphaerales bacterium]
MKRILILGTSALLALCAFLGCARQPTESKANPESERISIVTTTGMITDLATRIAGDRAEITGLMGSGIDPHLYTPTRSDIQKLLGADVVLYNGLHLEGKMGDALERVAGSGKTVRAVTEEIDESYLLTPAQFNGHHDPHVWMDPAAWAESAAVIRDTLSGYDPEGAEQYAVNAQTVINEINALDNYAERVLHSVPEDRRVLVTAHDAFSYFGRRYGYEVVGIQGISTESEAGVRDLERIVSLLVDRKIRAVFVETTVSERNIRALIAGAKARGHEVIIGGNLFSDAMGARGTYEGTYVGMIDHNVTTIVRSLGGDAPEHGMQGKLGESPSTKESP